MSRSEKSLGRHSRMILRFHNQARPKINLARIATAVPKLVLTSREPGDAHTPEHL